MKSAYDIIKKPVLTEKSYQDMAEKKFTFQVDVRANKTEIKKAIVTLKPDSKPIPFFEGMAEEADA